MESIKEMRRTISPPQTCGSGARLHDPKGRRLDYETTQNHGSAGGSAVDKTLSTRSTERSV
jgi:hypothetical protein